MAYGQGCGDILKKINKASEAIQYGSTTNKAATILTQAKDEQRSLTISESAKLDRRRVYQRLKLRQYRQRDKLPKLDPEEMEEINNKSEYDTEDDEVVDKPCLQIEERKERKKLRDLRRKNRMFEKNIKMLRKNEGNLRQVERLKSEITKDIPTLIDDDCINDNFVISQTKNQRKKLTECKVIAIDQLHNLQQVDSNACRTLKIEGQDETGEWFKCGNIIVRNKSATTHETIANVTWKKMKEENGETSLDDILFIRGDFELGLYDPFVTVLNSLKSPSAIPAQ